MHKIIKNLLSVFREIFVGRVVLHTEILALRQQVAVLKRQRPRPSLRILDRVFWVILSYLWAGWRLSLPFIPSCLPTAVRLSGTDIILSQRILKLTTGAVITMLIPPDRASKPMQGHADAGSVHGGTEKN